jgi:molecular chaperone DnaK
MNRVVWGAAAAIVVLGIAAILLLPHDLPKADPSRIWGAPRATGVQGSTPPVVGSPAAIPAILVVEQVSPIVGADGSLAESLGIETGGGAFTPVLPKGTRAPVMRFVTFKTSADNQREIRLHVLRGLADRVAQNHDLGWVRIPGLPAGPRGTVQVTVGFRIADGAVVLAALDPATGHGYTMETSEAPPGFPR